MLLEAEKLTLQMGERQLFGGLSFRISPGEIWTVTGPSGAGKTSLLRVLGGELAPSSGSVKRYGALGEIPQGLALNEELSALQNAKVGAFKGLGLWASLKKLFEPAADTERRLQSWGIQDPLQRLGSLSGGERQRVAVARALAEPWQVLLADEPISQLDEANARKVLGALRDEARKRQGALLLVLHHEGLAEEFSTNRIQLGDAR